MITKSGLGLATAALLAASLMLPSAAKAQRGAGGAAMHAAAPMARARVATARPPAMRAGGGPSRPVNAGAFFGPGSFFGPGFLGSGSYGNGFGRNLGVEAAIDP